METQILNSEIQSKTYSVRYLPEHIKKFVNLQYKTTTKNNYSIGLTKFYNYLTVNETKELNQANINLTIKEYKSNLENNTKLASTTIDNYTEIVKTFSKNYLGLKLQKIKRTNTGNSKQIKYLEYEEVKWLINTVQYSTSNPEIITRDKAIICTLFGAGLRISELLNIKLNDYNPDTNTILIIGKGRATDEPETIVLPLVTVKHINEYLQQRVK